MSHAPFLSARSLSSEVARCAPYLWNHPIRPTFRSYVSTRDNRSTFLKVLHSHENTWGKISHRTFVFIDHYTLPREVSLEAERSLTVENAGGKSAISEMFSIDYMVKKYHANSIVLEMEVVYSIDYKMVDYIALVDDIRVGVSVTRAMGFPTAAYFTSEDADRLLRKKLNGLIVARNSVSKHQSFIKSILHVWCQSPNIARLLKDSFRRLDDNDFGLDIKGVVILQLTVCQDTRIYLNCL
jgi:hypothetical protein